MIYFSFLFFRFIETGPADCDFDTGICGWQQDKSDDTNWEILSGPFPGKATKLFSDHSVSGSKLEGKHVLYHSPVQRTS